MTTCTLVSEKHTEFLGKSKLITMTMKLVSGDDTVTVASGLRRIWSWHVSSPAITAKAIDYGTVSDGTITLHVTNPAADEYLYFTIIGQ